MNGPGETDAYSPNLRADTSHSRSGSGYATLGKSIFQYAREGHLNGTRGGDSEDSTSTISTYNEGNSHENSEGTVEFVSSISPEQDDDAPVSVPEETPPLYINGDTQLLNGTHEDTSNHKDTSNDYTYASAIYKSTTDPSHAITLDILNCTSDKIKVDKGDECGVKYKNFFPVGAYRIGSVLEGEINIWKEGDKEICVFVRFYFNSSTLVAVGIYVNDNFELKCFQKNSNGWDAITGKKFNEHVKTLIGSYGQDDPSDTTLNNSSDSISLFEDYFLFSSAPYISYDEDDSDEENVAPPARDNHALDISKPDNNIVDTRDTKEDVIVNKYYYPKFSYEITSVFDGNVEIWKVDCLKEICNCSTNDARNCDVNKNESDVGCISVEDYIDLSADHKRILSLCLRSGGNVYYKYFEKLPKRWINITDKEFYDKYNNMKNTTKTPITL